MFNTPLEQFQIIPVLKLFVSHFDISVTNATIIAGLCLFFFITFLFILIWTDGSLYLVPNRWQSVLEQLYRSMVAMATDNIGPKGEKFFPFVFTLFLFIVLCNLVGLVPYSFTLTSHLIVTFSLALIVFISVNIICYRQHGLKMFSLFLPAGTPFALAFLLVPIELVSYIFKPISLSVRLFANLMAGHTLLKVIAGFGWSLMGCTGILFFAHYLPLLILLPLFMLELGVALIQAYVFSILTCIYLNDAVNLH